MLRNNAGMKSATGRVRQGYIWNAAAGLINAAEVVIMSMIVTRTTGLSDAGVLSIAFAIGNLLMPIGKFGLRNYQITDIEEEFTFSIYLKTRIVTVSLMCICIFGYLEYARVFLGYDNNKIGTIFCVCMIYAVEAIEDVIWGYYQQRNRLDLGARLFCIRWIGILIVFPIALYINKNLYRTMLLCFLVSLFLFAILLKLTYPCVCTPADRKVSIVIRRDDLNKISVLLKTAFPLCVIAVLSFFVNNAPKYAIDACLTDEIQACFGFVAMPVFVIRLLNNFIYQPLLVPMAMEWDQRKIKSFIRRIIQQTIMIIGISTVCLIGAYFLGIPVLSWLYSTDLSEYKEELMILLLGSGFMAESGYQSVVLTVMRCQKDLLWPYCLTAFIAVISLWRIVPIYGTLGAAVCYLTLMLLLCSLYSGILIKKICNFK